MQCDVSKADQVEALFNQIKEKWGRLDVIFNNAGVAPATGRIHELSLKEVTRVISINQMGAFHVLKYVITIF